MTCNRKFPSLDRLRSEFHYCARTGVLTKKSTGNVMRAKQEKGYIVCRFMGRTYLAHRICWAIHHDSDPGEMQVDHINGNRSDNRISNLRLATASQNGANKKSKPGSTSRYKGVYRRSDTGKYVAQITSNGKRRKLGSVAREIDAAAAYDSAAVEAHGEYAVVNFGIDP